MQCGGALLWTCTQSAGKKYSYIFFFPICLFNLEVWPNMKHIFPLITSMSLIVGSQLYLPTPPSPNVVYWCHLDHLPDPTWIDVNFCLSVSLLWLYLIYTLLCFLSEHDYVNGTMSHTMSEKALPAETANTCSDIKIQTLQASIPPKYIRWRPWSLPPQPEIN